MAGQHNVLCSGYLPELTLVIPLYQGTYSQRDRAGSLKGLLVFCSLLHKVLLKYPKQPLLHRTQR